MAQPTSRQELKDYALRRLGFPVIEINVDDSQTEDRLDDALQFFAEYHFDGVEKMYYKHEITSTDITNGYVDLDGVDSSIISVNRMFQFSDSSVNMFDIRYQMALNDFYGLRSGLSNIAYYDQIKRHLSLIQQTLDPEKQIRFSRVTNRLYGDFDWSEDTDAGEYLMVEAYTILDPETYTEIYNDRLLKQYVTALIKRQWGANLSKFENVQLPGGVSFNGTQLYEQAQQEIEKIEDEVQLRYELPPHFMTG
tara:strand:+ start:13 stop:765 length:753 start_codon:yes stop_codon:yes gene_type:complete